MYNMCHADVYPLFLCGSDDAAVSDDDMAGFNLLLLGSKLLLADDTTVSVDDLAGFTPTLLLLGSKLLLGRHFR